MYSSIYATLSPLPPSLFSHHHVDREDEDILLLHHQHNLSMAAQAASLNHCEAVPLADFPPWEKVLGVNYSRKKDRHSKIYTAQGPRDRRVRLSIQVARKFFDLQDMLGFDKASKTLDWLFTNSSTAIRDLVQMKLSSSTTAGSLSSSTSESEVVLGHGNAATGDTQGLISGRDQSISSAGAAVTKEKRMSQPASQALVKASRIKARQRARERTRGKLRNRNMMMMMMTNTIHVETIAKPSTSPNPSKVQIRGCGDPWRLQVHLPQQYTP